MDFKCNNCSKLIEKKSGFCSEKCKTSYFQKFDKSKCIFCGELKDNPNVPNCNNCKDEYDKCIDLDLDLQVKNYESHKDSIEKLKEIMFEDNLGYTYLFRGLILSKSLEIEKYIDKILAEYFSKEKKKDFFIEFFLKGNITFGNKLKILEIIGNTNLKFESYDRKNTLQIRDLEDKKVNIEAEYSLFYQIAKHENNLYKYFYNEFKDMKDLITHIRFIVELRNQLSHNIDKIEEGFLDPLPPMIRTIYFKNKPKGSRKNVEITPEYIDYVFNIMKDSINSLKFIYYYNLY